MSVSGDQVLRAIVVADTTLRDGEQAPGVCFSPEEKLRIARELETLGVDVIEAGFPAMSDAERDAVAAVAREVRGCTIAAFARPRTADIDRAALALRDAESPRLFTFVSTSDIQIRHQLDATRGEIKELARTAVARARARLDDVQLGAMDATRSDIEFLAEVFDAALDEGVTSVGIADTVGYALPADIERIVRRLREMLPRLEGVPVAVHCHNDLGLAVANTMAGVAAGATQVDCTVTGVGERAGNTPLEEIAALVHVRGETLGVCSNLDVSRLVPTSEFVAEIAGVQVAANKPVIGRHAFAHESGIHQHGILKDPRTYEILDPSSVGAGPRRLVLGKHAGRMALRRAAREHGLDPTDGQLEAALGQMKLLGERKAEVTPDDLALWFAGIAHDGGEG